MRVNSNYINFVSVVIITYDPTASHLQKTLNILLKQTYKNFEVIVVDSGENKLSTEIVGTVLKGTWVKHSVIDLRKKKGARFNYAHAYNIGIGKAKGEIVIRLSGDAVPVGNRWVQHCVDLMQQEHVGIISGTDIIENQLSLDTYLLSALYDRFRFMALQSSKRKVFKRIPMINGPCMIFLRSIWKQHKFNEKWLWGEEFEFVTWTMRKGYFALYDPKIRILHSHRMGSKDALQRIGADLLFAFKVRHIFQEQLISLIHDQLKTTIEVPFIQIEKGRQYYIKNGSVKIVQAYVEGLSKLKAQFDQFIS